MKIISSVRRGVKRGRSDCDLVVHTVTRPRGLEGPGPFRVVERDCGDHVEIEPVVLFSDDYGLVAMQAHHKLQVITETEQVAPRVVELPAYILRYPKELPKNMTWDQVEEQAQNEAYNKYRASYDEALAKYRKMSPVARESCNLIYQMEERHSSKDDEEPPIIKQLYCALGDHCEECHHIETKRE